MWSYDVCICFHPKDTSVIEYGVPSIRRFLPEANNIFIISEENPEIEETIWIPESSFPFSKDDVKSIIKNTYINRTGWYYQQLLKLYCFQVLPTKSEHILIIDADVLFKDHIDFFEEDKILLSVSPEHNIPYFNHMKALLNLEKQTEYSGIVHHIMLKRSHMEVILEEIERIHKQPAWKAMLSLVNPEDYDGSGMSEYEIYFNYCLKNFPEQYKYRKLPFANVSSFREINERKEALIAVHFWSRS